MLAASDPVRLGRPAQATAWPVAIGVTNLRLPSPPIAE
jgi:hypothetical protein